MSEELKDQSIYDSEELAGYEDEQDEEDDTEEEPEDDSPEEQPNGEEWDGEDEETDEDVENAPDYTAEQWTAEDERKYQELDTGIKAIDSALSTPDDKTPEARYLGKKGLPKTGGRAKTVRNVENALLEPNDVRLEKAFDTYDKVYMHKAARYLAPLILRRVHKILKDKNTPPATILSIGKDILPYAYDKPGTSDAKDEGPKKVMIVTHSMNLPDVS